MTPQELDDLKKALSSATGQAGTVFDVVFAPPPTCAPPSPAPPTTAPPSPLPPTNAPPPSSAQ